MSGAAEAAPQRLPAAPSEVGHFSLFSSLLGKETSVYTVEVEYPLG